MRTKTIPASWIQRDGHRLDSGPYMSGAFEAQIRLEKLSVPKEPLHALTSGHDGGIFNGPQFSRRWVNDPEYGVPFVGSSSMLRADLSHLPLLRKKDAYSNKLSFLRLEQGMTLISCSGTIGRMVYVRPDMEGMWSSQHIIKVVPNPQKILPGYLYAYLSSKFGVPLVVGGTYGAIIQHIEPRHIADLPVPRLGDEVEQRAHKLVEESSTYISEYTSLISEGTKRLFEYIGMRDSIDHEWHADQRSLGWTEYCVSSESLRALNFDPRMVEFRKKFEAQSYDELGSVCDPEWFKGKIFFKRIDASPEHSVMLVGQRNAFHMRPEGRWISRTSILDLGLQVPPSTTLIPSHGTLGENELYCQALIVTNKTSSYAYSGDFFRCIPLPERICPGYLFAFLRSRIAFRMLRSISAGSKQQEQHSKMMWRFPIPRLKTEQEFEIANLIDQACKVFDQGLDAEDEARTLVEQTIEELV